MKPSEQIKPISSLKAFAAEIVRNLSENHQPGVATVHGEAKAVLQDAAQSEETQETLALLKVLALTNQQVEVGKVRSAGEAFSRIRQHLSDDKA